MPSSRLKLRPVKAAGFLYLIGSIVGCLAAANAAAPRFTTVQPDLFTAPHALSNAFADFDGDGDLDLAVSFQDGAIRLYRNDADTFVDAGARLGLPTAGAGDPGPDLGRLRRRRRSGPACGRRQATQACPHAT